MSSPSLMRRLGGVLYEMLTVIALWMLASAIATTLVHDATQGFARILLQGLALLLVGGYFLWCWTHGGQTLAMKTWRMRVTDRAGHPLAAKQAVIRLVLAAASVLAAGAGLWWALFDREGLFLHDRLAGTQLVPAPKSA
jgi:uncharacterized RDD family membrane protein YckC